MLQIISSNIRYKDNAISEVDVRYNYVDEDLRFNGNVLLTSEEYSGNETPAELETIVKNRIVTSLNA